MHQLCDFWTIYEHFSSFPSYILLQGAQNDIVLQFALITKSLIENDSQNASREVGPARWTCLASFIYDIYVVFCSTQKMSKKLMFLREKKLYSPDNHVHWFH